MRLRTIRRHADRGFTLVELLLVLVILTALAAIVLPKLTGYGAQAKITQATTQISSFDTALSLFEVQNGRYPTSDEGLNSLVEAPGALTTSWKGPYLPKGVPNDPWGKPYVYECPGRHNASGYDIHSFGPDGQDGTDDDVTNWTTP